ncbi:hypothetical protein FH972_013498 [Carpinus fangiana]|uniref:Uncharacterized protein n=1 Tax=Carpinus fangiana TaxID=176857 RepID=A0A5N6R9G0_9ROSI|nr:hypothetical protein FH972_013498 [Carpinus fangiana]
MALILHQKIPSVISHLVRDAHSRLDTDICYQTSQLKISRYNPIEEMNLNHSNPKDRWDQKFIRDSRQITAPPKYKKHTRMGIKTKGKKNKPKLMSVDI